MIPKLEECAEIENSDAVDTRSDQSGSNEEIPTMCPASATSISWTYDISPDIFPFTGDCGIIIPLSVVDIPFLWRTFF
jgi:hypothetical protein